MTTIKEKKFLKDDIARKVLNAEECREFLIRIIALSLDFEVSEVRNNLKMIDTRVGNHTSFMNQDTDVLYENEEDIFNVELNYNYYEEGLIKNSCYIANLMIRQFPKGSKYKNFKKIHQINLCNYDLFKKGKFIYKSSMIEETLQIKRDTFVEIIDINLDILADVPYNDIIKLNENDLEWLLYIFVCSDEEEREKLYKENPIMRRVYDKMDNLTKSLNEMFYYDREEFHKNAAYHQGNKDGKIEGRQEEKMEIARKMLEKNISYEEIMNFTELTVKELKKIEKDILK